MKAQNFMSAFEEGLAAFKLKKYAKAFQLLNPIAEQGNAEAQCILGNMYQLGLGIEQDLTKAVQWYQKSSEQGYGVASSNLAEIWNFGGNNIVPDQVKAQQLSQKAIEQGFIFNVGRRPSVYAQG